MYATKTPSLRIHHSDLKCKSGCGFYGNAQWQGYCSKCHREQVQRLKRAEKASTSASASARDHQVLERQPKPPKITGFSKFEEKKLRQSDSLKKNKLLKLNVFRKSSNAKDHEPVDREYRDKSHSEITIRPSDLEKQKLDFIKTFPNLDLALERDTRRHVQLFFNGVIKQHYTKTVDELSDLTQSYYQAYAKRMDNSQNLYSNVDGETREALLDFVEKYSMTYLFSILFSPVTCDDEKKDSEIQSRIRQLCWVSPKHLDSHIDQANSTVRDLLYTAISELIAMDSVPSPGAKLAHVVECCRSVVKVIGAASGGPASADELLPALIFTVLKANPPRLLSNINYVTRFCNAARLMTGEAGYYFTNLCCAVSFVENLTAESLNMKKEDFNGYMSLPAIVGGGSWVVALSLCEGLHDLQEQVKSIQELDRKTVYIENEAKNMTDQIETFKEEVLKKIADVLRRTPLDLDKKRSQLCNIPEDSTLNQVANKVDADLISTCKEEIKPVLITNSDDIFGSCSDDKTATLLDSIPKELESLNISSSYSNVIINPPNTLSNLKNVLNTPPLPTLKTIGSTEFLSPSPVFGFGSFDTQSLDELATPDDFGSEQFLHGLTNVNYDIDLSDMSGENSAAEDVPIHKNKSQDPFSPEGITKLTNDPWTVIPIEPKISDVKKSNVQKPLVLNPSDGEASISILDSNDSPVTEYLLPSPIKPHNSFQ